VAGIHLVCPAGVLDARRQEAPAVPALPSSRSRRRTATAWVVACSVGVVALSPSAPAHASDRTGPYAGCAGEPATSATVVDALQDDRTLRRDDCHDVYVVDAAVPAPRRQATDPAPATVPADVFDLSSRPGSTRTIYLDFDGATYSGTRWNGGAEVVSPPYSVDGDPSTFTATEQAQVFLAWQVVAEDFAPFDVNVTTRRPDASALTRTSSTDTTYGMPVVVTATNAVGERCGCGGSAYVGVFGAVDATDVQPAWVFTHGSGTAGYDVGQAVSHEVGHTFGLAHDGTSQGAYYSGAGGWAPIMGASYGRRASQWSSGEYADASNAEDDVAVIARTAPVLADDHPGTRLGARAVEVGSTAGGTITTRSDTDAFTFTANGPVTASVSGPAGVSDLDVRLTVLGPLGTTLATVDPVADSASDDSMSAAWSTDVTVPTTFTLVVDGTGAGDPGADGRYSDYGSLGAYTVTVEEGGPPATPSTPSPSGTAPGTTSAPTSGATPAPTAGVAATHGVETIAFTTTRLPRAHVGRPYRAAIRFTGQVVEARVDWRLPAGLRWAVAGDRIVIHGTVRRRTSSRFASVLSGEGGPVRRQFRIVAR
jgi:hypothetical protein